MQSGTTTVATTTTGKATAAPAGGPAPAGTTTSAGTTTAPGTTPSGATGTTTSAAQASHTHPLAAHAALLQAHAHAVTKVTPIAPPAVHTSFVQNLQNWALNWE